MNITETPLLTVPLGRVAHRQASQFAAEQATPQKGKRVYLNTLAVYAVHSYLKWLQIETDLSQGESWHPGLQALFDVADLVLPGIGKLECRPVLPGETTFSLPLPLEVNEDRIGYVAVLFSERLDEVQLLGFVRHNTSNVLEQIPIADIQPIDALLEYIPVSTVDEIVVSTASKMPVNLSFWLRSTFEAGWQTVEALFNTEALNPAFSVRSIAQLRHGADNPAVGVSRGKLINLGTQLATYPVALLVTLVPAENEEVDICLRVYPTGQQIYLPPNLRLIVLDESGITSLEAEARSTDNWIQLELSGQPGEHFSIQLTLGDISITEDFVI